MGGAIYYSDSRNQGLTERPCFFQIRKTDNTKYLWELRGSVQLKFRTNHAKNGGEDIYGEAIHSDCYLLHHTGLKELTSNELLSYIQVFDFYNGTSSLSSISSDPKRVCLCDDHGTSQCASEHYILYDPGVTLYPGESTTIPAVVVGKEFGTLSFLVYAQIFPRNNTSDIYWAYIRPRTTITRNN